MLGGDRWVRSTVTGDDILAMPEIDVAMPLATPMQAWSLAHKPSDPRNAAPLIRDRALALGFDAFGFCRAELGAQARERLADFLAAGQHGDMGWLAHRARQRSAPAVAVAGRAQRHRAWPVLRAGRDPLATLALRRSRRISVYARDATITT